MNATHEVYQVAKDVIEVGTGVNDPPVVDENGGGFVVYPNPARDKSYIFFDKETRTDNTIIIYNNLGSVVATTHIARGMNRTELPTGNLPAGIYMIRAFSGNRIDGRQKADLDQVNST